MNREANANTQSWFDQPANRRMLFIALAVGCAVVFIADFFVAHKGPFGIKQWYGAFALLGFASCVTLGLAARAWRKIVSKPREYYDE